MHHRPQRPDRLGVRAVSLGMRAEAALARVHDREHDRIDARRACRLAEQLGRPAAGDEDARARVGREPIHEVVDLVAREPVEARGRLGKAEGTTDRLVVPWQGAVTGAERNAPAHQRMPVPGVPGCRSAPRDARFRGARMIRWRSRVSQNPPAEGVSDATVSVPEAAVLTALRAVLDPDLHTDVVTLGFVRELRVDAGRVSFTLELTTPACPAKGLLERQAREAVLKVPGITDVSVKLTARVRAAGIRPGDETPQIKNTIA